MTTQARIHAITQEREGVLIEFDGGTRTFCSWLWLKDHGEDEGSLDPATLQRRVDTFCLPECPAVRRTIIEDDGNALVVEWAGDQAPAVSRLSAQLLSRIGGGERDVASAGRVLWSERANDDEPALRYADVVDSQAGLADCLKRIEALGYAVVDGTPAHESGASRLFKRFGYIRETIFGGLWRLSAELQVHEDTAYTTSYLAPHTDGTYSHDAPGLQSFACLTFDGDGGESILVDGFAAAEALRLQSPEHFETLTKVDVPGRYVEPGVHLRASRPAIRTDTEGAVVQVSLNNYDRAPFWLPQREMHAFYAAYRALNELVMDRARWRLVPLRPGMALIFDNWRVLHGRMAYTGKRVFCGCYHNREDYESALRVCSAGTTV